MSPVLPLLLAGTFITEWIEGEKICGSFLAGEEEAYLAVAKQLAAVAEFYRFDGWLINIENSLHVSQSCFLLVLSLYTWIYARPKPGWSFAAVPETGRICIPMGIMGVHNVCTFFCQFQP